ncbi:fibulin-1 isoform X1, partial [Paramuricea clavata]
MEVIKQKNPNCQAIGRTAESAVRAASGFICRTSAELCCVKQMQENLCSMGKSVAINGGTCSAQTSLYYGREDHQECCYCCYLGMEAKRRKMGCGTKAVLGFPCQKSFTNCCLLDDPHPSGTPNIFGQAVQVPTPSIIPTRPTRTTRTCSNLRCSQSCVLLSGVPTCVCRSGFQINRNGRTCDDVNECASSGACDQNKICKNTYGSHECTEESTTATRTLTCGGGLEVDSSGKQCRDINECLQSPCQAGEECINSRGSYRCNPRCPSTYVFRNGRCQRACRLGSQWNGNRCVDENECRRPGICQSNQRCVNTIGSYRCVSAPVRRCNRGFERVGQNCVDIDECERYKSRRPCRSRTCVNIPGSYRCVAQCRQGFEMVNSVCKDVNECNQSPCSSNEQCQNIQGSYRCRCRRGYKRVGSTCQDDNECLRQRSPCPRDEVCENIPASYRCKCRNGFERSGSRCYDINECNKNLCGADETCINRPGTYRCEKKASCDPGYRLYRGTCVDVNECLENKRKCSADKECINMRGSYRCRVKCSSGYERVQLRDDCKDINECERNNACRSDEECQNLPGKYLCAKVRRCRSGYERFNGNCQDKDECTIPNICRPPRTICENTPGSYRCVYKPCPYGFERARNGQCQDVNECTTGRHICKPLAEQCINVNGTYSCRCNNGYFRTGGDKHCRDKDECRGPDQYCAHKCVNTEGSFRCECRKGYALADTTNCYDVNECSRQGSVRCEQNCINTQGSYYCQCNRGYTLHSNGLSCS